MEKIQEILNRAKDEIKSIEVKKPVPLEFDLAHLMASDTNEVLKNKFRDIKETNEYLKDLARDGVQALLNKVWDLPSESIDNTIYVSLPQPTFRLPREKHVPKPKPPTKWEEYAKQKGIKKRRKGNKEWDETLKDWIPRYGYRKAAAEREKNWVMEVPDNADPYEDQFEKASSAKKERVAKNEYLRLRNIAKAKNVKVPKPGVTSTTMNTTKEMDIALKQTRVSTASLGKFQPRLDNERPLDATISRGKKRKLPANETKEQAMKQDKERALKVLSKMKKSDMDYETAVNKQIKFENIESSHPGRKKPASKRRSKQGGRHRSKGEHRALGKGLINPKGGKKGGAAKGGGGMNKKPSKKGSKKAGGNKAGARAFGHKAKGAGKRNRSKRK